MAVDVWARAKSIFFMDGEEGVRWPSVFRRLSICGDKSQSLDSKQGSTETAALLWKRLIPETSVVQPWMDDDLTSRSVNVRFSLWILVSLV